MRRVGGQATRWAGALGLVALGAGLAWAGAPPPSGYNVVLDTSPWTGRNARLTFDLTSSNLFQNTLTIFNFSHDGRVGLPETQGGLVTGDIILGYNPAFSTTINDDYFLNELVVNFDSLGTQVSFAVYPTYNSFGETQLFDEMSFFVLGHLDAAPFGTADPLGTNALFSVSIDQDYAGDLSVFSPAVFVPPDTIKLTLPVTGVAYERAQDRLRFRSAWPNPARSSVRFDFEVPAPRGRVRLRVYDIAGRVVSEPLNGTRAAGAWSAIWTGSDRAGRRLPAGVYLARLDLGGQSVVRKIVLER